MPTFTMRRTWPDDDRPDDYVFRVDGREAGRCYAMRAAGDRPVWRWTVYGSATGGMALSLEEARREFQGQLRRELVQPYLPVSSRG